MASRTLDWVSVLGTAGVIVGFHAVYFHPDPLNVAVVFYLCLSGLLVLFLVLSVRGRTWEHRRPASGRVVAVVPTFNEDTEVLHRAVRSLLEGSVAPDVIHVVDDGSDEPVVTFDDPRVVWHRQRNQGKRAAQVNALRGETARFVVTVDSDSVVGRDSLHKALQALSQRRVMAVTVTVAVLNRTQNFLTRLTDLEMVYGCLVVRGSRSVLGAVAPTSGAFAVYRSEILFDNLEDYLASGTCGDDRRLTHYSLLRGQVVAITDAVVETVMPATLPSMFRQRVRWFESYFRYLGWELGHLHGIALVLRVWSLFLLSIFPMVMLWLFVVVPLRGGPVLWQVFVYWLLLTYFQTIRYVSGHPVVSSAKARWAAWLFLTPLLMPLQLFVLRPAMYVAMLRPRDVDWGTRREAAGPTAAARPLYAPTASITILPSGASRWRRRRSPAPVDRTTTLAA